MRRLRICQLITELRPAGAEKCVYELARRLDARRFSVSVVALRGGEVADRLGEAGIDTTVLDVRGKWDLVKLRGLCSVLRSRGIDILHTHLFHADLAGRWAAVCVGTPHVIHTVHVAEMRFRPWQFAWARLAAESCDRIVCVSRAVTDHHSRKSGLPRRRYQVIPNGVDPADMRRDEHTRRRLREQWGISDDEVLTAFVGRLDYQKGVSTLLAAMSHLGARGTPRSIVIAGDGPKRGLVENFIAHGEGGRRCRFLGFTPDVRGVLSAADIFAMPSRWEGFGLAAAEAMSASLPVIATRVAGLCEVVVNGQTGIVIEPNNGVALAEAVETLIRDPQLRARMGAAGLTRVRECFGIDANIAAHEALYMQVASDVPCP